MNDFTLTATCNFGVESILARELKALGITEYQVTDGRIDFPGDPQRLVQAALWLRSAERLFIRLSAFPAATFEELFQGVRAIPWGDWLPLDANFPVVKATSLKSALFSVPDIQAIVKKAAVEKMKAKYGVSWFEETGAKYPIHVFLYKDMAHIYLDAGGRSLHKRGYRLDKNIAPLKESLAFALVALTPWRPDRILIDPLCGSGTILIEAALQGINRAPGFKGRFQAEAWPVIPQQLWRRLRLEAKEAECPEREFLLQGYDIDERVLRAARANAAAAGVEKHIHWQQRDVRQLSSREKYGFIVTNPPYGQRLEEQATVEQLYRDMGKRFLALDTWSYNIITAYLDFERCFGRKADKKRKLYNGMLKTNLYQYFGPKPPKQEWQETL